MYKYLIISLLGFTACSNSQDLLAVDEQGIIGGTLIADDSVIADASLLVEFKTVDSSGNIMSSICSGVAISNRLVLTAAHCIKSPGKRKYDHTVVITKDKSKGGKQIAVQQSVPHPEYSGNPNDVGVLVLEETLPPEVIPAAIAFERRQDRGDLITISGYGLESRSSNEVGRLKSALVTVRGMTSDGVILTMQEEQAAGCSGDSGGAVWRTTKGKPHVIGIISAGSDSSPICNDVLLIATTGLNRDFIEDMLAEYP